MSDQIVRAMSADGFVKASVITSKEICERARQIHKTLPTATAALGRVLTACSMMGNTQKADDGSLSIIDFNDWPSFSACRTEAASSIAKAVIAAVKQQNQSRK